jgi:hypothetical protein
MKLYKQKFKEEEVFSQSDGQGFLLCWYSLNVQPGTAADLKN